MRSPLFIVLLAALAALAGCEAVPAGIRERFDSAPAKTQTVGLDKKTVYHAAQSALKKMDFTLTRSAIGEGIVTAIGRMRSSEAFRDARQYEFEVTVRETPEGGTEVGVRLIETVEDGASGGPTRKLLREHGLYDSFFEALAAALNESGAAPAVR